MPKNRFNPSTLVIHYCFAMVLAGCIGVSLNKQIFDQDNTSSPPIELTAETTTTSSELALPPDGVPARAPDRKIETSEDYQYWSCCPNHEGVKANIKSCRNLIAATTKIAATMHNGALGKSEKGNEVALNKWRAQARDWKTKNDTILQNCGCLLGATGVQVFPEIPLALQNLKHAGTWLDWSIAAEQFGEHKEAAEYIAAANRAANQASKLINHKIRPRTRTALVKLPKNLERFSLSAL